MRLMINKNTTDKRVYSHTCFNKIRIPGYSTREQLEEGIMTAINSVKYDFSII